MHCPNPAARTSIELVEVHLHALDDTPHSKEHIISDFQEFHTSMNKFSLLPSNL